MKLKDLARPEDFAALPLLDLADAQFLWRVGYSQEHFGTYLGRPAYFEVLRRDAVLSAPSFNERRYLVIELTDDQFNQAMQLNEQAIRAKEAFDDRLLQNQLRYSRLAEPRIQARHLGERLGRHYLENIVLGWIDGPPNWLDHSTLW